MNLIQFKLEKNLSQGTVFTYSDKTVNKVQSLEFPKGPHNKYVNKPYKGRGHSLYMENQSKSLEKREFKVVFEIMVEFPQARMD